MSERESTYKAEAWRMTGYYPETYAKFMAALGVGIDYDDDFDRYESQFRADLAAHDREVAAKALRDAAAHLPFTYMGVGTTWHQAQEALLARAAELRGQS